MQHKITLFGLPTEPGNSDWDLAKISSFCILANISKFHRKKQEKNNKVSLVVSSSFFGFGRFWAIKPVNHLKIAQKFDKLPLPRGVQILLLLTNEAKCPMSNNAQCPRSNGFSRDLEIGNDPAAASFLPWFPRFVVQRWGAKD